MISIIIPTYNDINGIKKQINFFNRFNKSDLKFEVIFVDDCSTDNTSKLFENERIEFECLYLKNSINSGPGFSRNNGIKAAKYEFIAFVDSDDTLIDSWDFYFKRMLSYNNDCMVYPYQLIVKDSENVYKMHQNDEMIFNKWGLNSISEDYIWNVSWTLELANFPWNKIYKKSIIEEHGIYFPDLRMQEDVVFHWMYMIHCKTVKLFSDFPGLYKHNRSDNNTGRATEYKGKNRLDLFSALNMVEDKLTEDWLLGYLPVFYSFKCDIINWGRDNISHEYLDEFNSLIKESMSKFDEAKKDIIKKHHHHDLIQKIESIVV